MKPPTLGATFWSPSPSIFVSLAFTQEQLDLTLGMLKNASPNEIDDEEETICAMEQKSSEMGNLIEKKVLQCTDKKDQLEMLNEQYLQALALYQQLMQEPANPIPPSYQTHAAASPQQQSLLYQQQMLAHVSFYHHLIF